MSTALGMRGHSVPGAWRERARWPLWTRPQMPSGWCGDWMQGDKFLLASRRVRKRGSPAESEPRGLRQTWRHKESCPPSPATAALGAPPPGQSGPRVGEAGSRRPICTRAPRLQPLSPVCARGRASPSPPLGHLLTPPATPPHQRLPSPRPEHLQGGLRAALAHLDATQPERVAGSPWRPAAWRTSWIRYPRGCGRAAGGCRR